MNKTKVKLPVGQVRVSVSAENYGSAIKNVDLQSDSEVRLKLYPRRAPQVMSLEPDLLEGKKWLPAPVWQPQPALIIGLGGTGRYVLTHVKKNLLDAGAGSLSEKVRLALFDTSDYELLAGEQVAVSFAGISLDVENVVELGEDLAPMCEDIRNNPAADTDISSWFPASDYSARVGRDELNLLHGTRLRRPPARALLMRDLRKGIPSNGLRIALLIDSSESMGAPFSGSDETISKLDATKSAAIHFLDQLDPSLDKVSIVQFDSEANVLLPLSNDVFAAKQAVQKITSGYQTSIHTALNAANQSLSEAGEENSSLVAILLSDGQGTFDETALAASNLREKGIRLITVGIGDVHEDLMRQIASTNAGKPEYYYASDASALKRIYVTLARRLGDGSKIWRLLHGAAGAALDADNNLRVIITGSLAGGFGSAILSDIAYLARRAGYEAKASSVSVEAYLATDGAFNQVVSNFGMEKYQSNTYASLREIERFQLAQGFPFRMTYLSSAEGDKVLAGAINWRLLDEIYLFDHTPDFPPVNPEQEKIWFEPRAGVFPAMADMVTLWLDKAARTGALAEYRRSIQSDVTGEQWARGRAVFGGVGSFVYRLPLFDMFEILKARWARSLLYYLLLGAPAANDLRLRPEQNREESAKKIEEHVQLFLLGYAGYDQPSCPPFVELLGKLAVEGFTSALRDELKNISAADVQAQLSQYRDYLLSAVLTMLNGLRSSNEISVARSGKAGYVLAFLESLRNMLNLAQGEFSSQKDYADIVQKYTDTTKDVANSLEAHIEVLKGGAGGKTSGVLNKLSDLELAYKEKLKDFDAIIVRRYLFSEKLLDDWYKAYFSDPKMVETALSRFYWAANKNGELALTLRTWEEYDLSADAQQQTLFIKELLRLAGYVGRSLLEKETLSSVLAQTALSPDQLLETADNLRVGSKPLLNYVDTKAPHAKLAWTAGVNSAVEADRLWSAVKQGMTTQDRQFKKVNITDPYTMIVSQSIDVIPLDAINSLDTAYGAYARWYGLSAGSSVDPRAEPTTVYRAEKIALMLERRMQTELFQSSRILCPVVVTALGAGMPARLFALCYAAGWMREEDETVVMMMPTGREIPIKVESQSGRTRQIPRVVQAFVNFAAYFEPDQLEAVKTAISSADQVAKDSWQAWTRKDWQTIDLVRQLIATQTVEGNDFATVTALVTRDQVQEIRKKN